MEYGVGENTSFAPKKLPISEAGGILAVPFAPTLEPFGSGSNLAFFLCETPEGPAVASSS